MAIILSSSDSAPLSSVIICRNIILCTLNMLFRDELFALGGWTNLVVVVGCTSREGALISFTVVGWACATDGGWGCCCVFCRKGQSWGGVAGREHPSRHNLGHSLQFSLSHLFLGVPTASIVGGMRFLSIHQLPVAVCRYWCYTSLFQALLVQVAPTPHMAGRLLAVSQDTAKLLADVNTVWDKSGLCMPIPWLQYGKGSSVWISHRTLTSLVRLLGRGEYLPTNSQLNTDSLCSLAADCIENTASNISSIVVCVCGFAMVLVLLHIYTVIA